MSDRFRFGEIGSLLGELGIIELDARNIETFHRGVRDRGDINVLRDRKTNIIFLDKIAKTTPQYTARKTPEQMAVNNDNIRRASILRAFVKNRKWADIGAGSGGLLAALNDHPEETHAVETDENWRDVYNCPYYSSIKDLPDGYFDVITCMHVLEHMENPFQELLYVHEKLKKGGYLFIEVPHAKDFLIHNCQQFRSYTFWSEHLLLPTRECLQKLLYLTGFKDIKVQGIQRYPLANHLFWLKAGKPGGEEKFLELVDPDLDYLYGVKLAQMDSTDTLWARAIA